MEQLFAVKEKKMTAELHGIIYPWQRDAGIVLLHLNHLNAIL